MLVPFHWVFVDIESISASGKLEEDTEKLLVEIINELKKNLN